MISYWEKVNNFFKTFCVSYASKNLGNEWFLLRPGQLSEYTEYR